jgi:hypothetical protein
MTDEQPVMVACAPGSSLADGDAHARGSVQSLALLLLLISPC